MLFPMKWLRLMPSGRPSNLEPYTMSISPFAIGWTSEGIYSGRYSRSASCSTRIFPWASLIPVRIAAPLPWLTWWRMYFMNGKACTFWPVLSVEPSSTTMISTLPIDQLTLMTRCKTSLIVSSSQYAGIIMLTSGVVDGCVNEVAPCRGWMLKLLLWAVLIVFTVSRVCFVLLMSFAI